MVIIPISGEIGWDVMPNNIRDQITAAAGDDITFEISSPGGYVYDGLEIFNLIRNYEGKTTAKIVGMAASMASYIPLAADYVIAESNAIYMIHNARAYAYGDQNAHNKIAGILTGLSNMLSDQYVAKTGLDKSEIKAFMDEEKYFFGAEMLDAGFVDEIITVEDSEAKDDKVLNAMLKVEAVIEKLKQNPEKQQNIERIAAILKPAANDVLPQPGTPVLHNQNHKDNMTFEEFIAKFPEEAKRIHAWLEAEEKKKFEAVQAEHKKLLEDAKSEVETGKLTKEQVGAVAGVISSTEYGKSIKNIGVRVLTGEKAFDDFLDFVAMADEQNEKAKSKDVQDNQPSATPGENHAPDQVNEAKLKADARAIGMKLGTAKPEGN